MSKRSRSSSRESPIVKVADPELGEVEYTIDEILDGGFKTQQIVIDDKSGAKVIKVLIESKFPAMHIFFFDKKFDKKTKMYEKFNSTSSSFIKALYSHLDFTDIPEASIHIAIFPMRIWQSDILTEDGSTSNLFNSDKKFGIKHALGFTSIESPIESSISKKKRGGSRKRNRTRKNKHYKVRST
jgi:hypothetical protein